MDKVEQITGIIGDPKSWKVTEVGGELVMVDVPGRPGVKQKMRKDEAVRLGLWKETEDQGPTPEKARGQGTEEEKARAPVRNKARRAGANKRAGSRE